MGRPFEVMDEGELGLELDLVGLERGETGWGWRIGDDGLAGSSSSSSDPSRSISMPFTTITFLAFFGFDGAGGGEGIV